jgi:hypothetical protein
MVQFLLKLLLNVQTRESFMSVLKKLLVVIIATFSISAFAKNHINVQIVMPGAPVGTQYVPAQWTCLSINVMGQCTYAAMVPAHYAQAGFVPVYPFRKQHHKHERCLLGSRC